MTSVTRIVVPIVIAMMVVESVLASPSGVKSHFLGSSLAVPPSTKASQELEMANALLQRLLDVAYETARDFGVQEHELKEVQRKRNIIQACFFQAITCY